MEINCFRFSNEGLVRRDDERPETTWLERDSVIRWLDIQYEAVEQVIELLAPLEIDPDLLEQIGKEEGVKVETGDRAILLTIPRSAASEQGRWTYFSALGVAETLVTFHRDGHLPIEMIAAKMRRMGHHAATQLADAVYLMLDLMVDMDITYFQRTRRAVEHLADEMDSLADDEVVTKILDLRHQAQHLEEVAEDLATLNMRLLTLRSTVFELGDMRSYFHEAGEAIKHYQRWLQRLDSRLQDLYEHYQLRLQSATNSRLQVLTVISAIFLPLTLVAGIYGMNFQNMPELAYPNAYHICLGFMGALGIGMLVFFYVRGWFR